MDEAFVAAEDTCEDLGIEMGGEGYTNCVITVGTRDYERQKAAAFAGDAAAEQAARRAVAGRVGLGILGAVGDGLTAYGAGLSAAAVNPVPVYAPPPTLTCQNFGGIVRCR
jgi:hypothetical protein